MGFDVSIEMEYDATNTETGEVKKGEVVKGNSVQEVAKELDRISRGGDVEVSNIRNKNK